MARETETLKRQAHECGCDTGAVMAKLVEILERVEKRSAEPHKCDNVALLARVTELLDRHDQTLYDQANGIAAGHDRLKTRVDMYAQIAVWALGIMATVGGGVAVVYVLAVAKAAAPHINPN